jgi:hypothetical protein
VKGDSPTPSGFTRILGLQETLIMFCEFRFALLMRIHQYLDVMQGWMGTLLRILWVDLNPIEGYSAALNMEVDRGEPFFDGFMILGLIGFPLVLFIWVMAVVLTLPLVFLLLFAHLIQPVIYRLARRAADECD